MRIVCWKRPVWRWLAGAVVLFCGAIVLADKQWPLPLHEVTPARGVVAEDGSRPHSV